MVNRNIASCIMPWVDAEGWVDFEISINGGPFMWTGKFFVETPARSPAMVWFQVQNLLSKYCSVDMEDFFRIFFVLYV